jgi:hypothetical protein
MIMANEPDSEADNFAFIEVLDTPERDNPKFGAVTLRIEQSSTRSQSLRMTTEDAETLVIKLTKYLNNKESN